MNQENTFEREKKLCKDFRYEEGKKQRRKNFWKFPCSLPSQLKEKFRFICSTCNTQTCLDSEMYMAEVLSEYYFHVELDNYIF